jgi:hypothetical protein
MTLIRIANGWKNLTIQQKKGTKSGKFKFSPMYFAGTITIEIIGKLTGLD